MITVQIDSMRGARERGRETEPRRGLQRLQVFDEAHEGLPVGQTGGEARPVRWRPARWQRAVRAVALLACTALLAPAPAAGDYLFAEVLDNCASPPPAPPRRWAATLQGCIVAANGSLSGRLACTDSSTAALSVFLNGDCAGTPFGTQPVGDVGGCTVLAAPLAFNTSCVAGDYVPSSNASLTLWSFDAPACPPGASAVLNMALTVAVPTLCMPAGAGAGAGDAYELSCDAASQDLLVLDFGGDSSCAGAPRNTTAAPLGCSVRNANATLYAATCGERQPFSAAPAGAPLAQPPAPIPSAFLALTDGVGAWAGGVKARAVRALLEWAR